MNELTFLTYKKLKNGRWECRDKNGNVASGLTKQMAENQYYALYQASKPSDQIDISQFMKKL